LGVSEEAGRILAAKFGAIFRTWMSGSGGG